MLIQYACRRQRSRNSFRSEDWRPMITTEQESSSLRDGCEGLRQGLVDWKMEEQDGVRRRGAGGPVLMGTGSPFEDDWKHSSS